MAKKLTQDDIIKRIREVHGDKYDLSKIVYKNTKSKIELICKEHGSWLTRPEQLFIGQGCFTCGKKQSGISGRTSFKDFVNKANEIHVYKYTYFKDSYKKFSSKTKIECPDHGVFFQSADEHARSGQGCPQCGLLKLGDLKRLPLDEFILRSKGKHSDKYDYSKVDYKKNNIKVIIICPEHGEFEQEPQNHLNGSGCFTCGVIETHDKQRKSNEDFISDSIKIHGDRYGYSKVNYIDSKTSIKIICNEHGPFSQVAGSHIAGSGCPKCAIIESHIKQRKSTEEFIKDSIFIHGNKYDYSNVNYVGKNTKVEIICKKHGVFVTNPGNHVSGSGCPNCNISRGEELVKRILTDRQIEFHQQYTFRKLRDKAKLKCDFYLPFHNMVIEFNGKQHYEPVEPFGGEKGFNETRRRDEIKRTYLKSKGIPLLEINYQNETVEETILTFISELEA